MIIIIKVLYDFFCILKFIIINVILNYTSLFSVNLFATILKTFIKLTEIINIIQIILFINFNNNKFRRFSNFYL